MGTHRARRSPRIRITVGAALAASTALMVATAIASADDSDAAVDAIWDDYSHQIHEIAEQNAGRFDETDRASAPGDLAAANQELMDALTKALNR